MIFYIQENDFNFVKPIVNTIFIFLDINYEDNLGKTLVCHAVRYSSDDVIEVLLTNVANLNIYNGGFYINVL